jgi:hypothetical protein
MSEAVFDGLVACLRSACEYNRNAQVGPVALLWPDEARQWAQVIDRIGERLPVLTLGDFDASKRRGPAYWIRCVLAGTLSADLQTGVPVVYLPGVGRSSVRAVDSCPAHLAPIAELQYRSQWFSHPNSRDWSVRALLTHPVRGLALHIADDRETASALLLALDRVLDEPLDRLKRQVLDADFFHDLVNPDPVRSVLDWLDDPGGFSKRFQAPGLSAFIQQCKADFGFDPMVDGEISAARKLAGRQGRWAQAWKRFAEQPDRYPGITGQLRKARPDDEFIFDRDAWPQENDAAEGQLRGALQEFAVLTPEGARKEVAHLEGKHAWRRGTVWADLGQAPLAFALEQLAAVANVTSKALAGDELASLRTDYEQRGWLADDAVLRALAAVHSAVDRSAVSAAIRALYLSWLDAGARALQSAVGPMANAHTYVAGGAASTDRGIVTIFVDGLRLDVARRIQMRLNDLGLTVETSTSLAALPTVTETAKPLLAPLPPGALAAGPDLHAANAVTGTVASIPVLRSLMQQRGVQILGSIESGDPSGSAWTETGEIDHRGHDLGARFVDSIDEEVQHIVDRIRELLDAGWKRVDVVTDHGWILLPGGMEKVELKPATAEIKKGRCARLKDGTSVSVPTVPWFWDPDVRIALAPGASCFEANKDYEHGGVSPQECFVPRLSVKVGIASTAASGPAIKKVKWLGQLCRIELSGVSRGVVVDLRALPADPGTSIAEKAKETLTTGKVSLVVPDEGLASERAFVVVIAADGQILAQRETTVGSNR